MRGRFVVGSLNPTKHFHNFTVDVKHAEVIRLAEKIRRGWNKPFVCLGIVKRVELVPAIKAYPMRSVEITLPERFSFKRQILKPSKLLDFTFSNLMKNRGKKTI